jgi:DNA-binding response OmpR family regulator
MKVLLVADEVWIRNEAIAALSDPGTVIREVADPRRASHVAEEFEPDVVIVDMQVGSMGGMAVARALREAEFADDIPPTSIVLLLDRTADEFLAGRAAADAWVVKPFTPQQLRAAIYIRHRQPGGRTLGVNSNLAGGLFSPATESPSPGPFVT